MFSYSIMHSTVSELANKQFATPSDVRYSVHRVYVEQHWPARGMYIEVQASKAILRADRGLTYTALCNKHVSADGVWYTEERWAIKGLKVPCIIGVNGHERERKQDVILHLTFRLRYVSTISQERG